MSTKLTEEELQSISQLEQDYAQIKLSIGDIVARITDFEEKISELELEKFNNLDTYKKIVERDKQLNSTLSQKYGRGIINVATGEISEA